MGGKTDRFIVKPQLSGEYLAYHDMVRAAKEIGPSYTYMDTSLVKEADIEVGVREVKQVPPDIKPYIEHHKHEVSQLYLIFGDLTVEFILEDERHEVSGPASVFIPAGMMHTTCPLRGSGCMVIILRRGEYK